ncbi:MAG: hypothetical protein LBI38_06215 [Oscillospiraceae bacterium]|jgi:WD40 repeat protein|nr:hypothetical protein [Oscillospiraceae bacterium]
MKVKKILAVIIAVTMCAGAFITGVSAADVPLGAPNWDNNANQKGWRPDGVDGVENSAYTTEVITSADALVVELNYVPEGGSFAVVWQGDGDGWVWNEYKWDELEGFDDVLSGTTVTIPLADYLPYYEDYVASGSAKLLLGYWGPDGEDFDALVKSAKLTGATVPDAGGDSGAAAGGGDAGAGAGGGTATGGDDKAGTDTGAAGVAALFGVAVIAAGAVAVSRKRG